MENSHFIGLSIGLYVSAPPQCPPLGLDYNTENWLISLSLFYPQIQMLHCIEQADSTGGENQFVDGLNVSEQVRREYPDSYELLRTREIDFRDVGTDYRTYHLKYRRPMIQ